MVERRWKGGEKKEVVTVVVVVVVGCDVVQAAVH